MRVSYPINRKWAMPSPDTFSIPPIADLLRRWVPRERSESLVCVDPFARNSTWGTVTNDLNPDTSALFHEEATKFLRGCAERGVRADVVLFDPPYSPRQISECYKGVGLSVGIRETQSGRLYKDVRDGLDLLLKSNGIAISFGWNSGGFGIGRGFTIEEILLVAHGGARNDTIVVVERKRRPDSIRPEHQDHAVSPSPQSRGVTNSCSVISPPHVV